MRFLKIWWLMLLSTQSTTKCNGQQCVSQPSFTFTALQSPAATTDYISILGSTSPLCSLEHASLALHDGQALVNGYQLFVAQANSIGGISVESGTYTVELHLIDDDCNVTLTKNAYNNLITTETVAKFYVSPYDLTSTQLAYDMVKENVGDSIMISPVVNTPAAYNTTASNSQLYGMLPNPSQYLQTAFDFMAYLNATHNSSSSLTPTQALYIGILDDQSSSYCSNEQATALASMYNLTLQSYSYVNSSNLSSIENAILNLKYTGVDVVIGCTSYELCPSLVQSINTVDYSPQGMIVTDCTTFSDLYNSSDASITMPNLFSIVPWSPDDTSIKSDYSELTPVDFKNLYLNTFGYVPSYYAASAYSCAEMYLTAIKQADNISAINLLSNLNNKEMTKNVLFGNISYTSDNRQSTFPLSVVQIGDNFEQIVVFRNHTNYGFAEIKFPVYTYKQKQCMMETGSSLNPSLSCSGHGQCVSSGRCTCVAPYYDEISHTKNQYLYEELKIAYCNAFCDGTYIAGNSTTRPACVPDLVYYIGGSTLLLGGYAQYGAVMNFTVDLLV